VTTEFLSPSTPIDGRAEVFLGYLDYFRGQLVEKVRSLPADQLATSRLPSNWTPLELLNHLRHVERRWLEWGFEGLPIDDPWADNLNDRWYVPPSPDLLDTRAALIAALAEQAARTGEIVRAHELTDVGQPGPRWDGDEPPPLERILFHLLQEYARHVGHLDIVAELAGGGTGE